MIFDAVTEFATPLIFGVGHSGEKGDGLIWVGPVAQHSRIRDVPPEIANS